MYIYKITNKVNGKIYIGQVYNKTIQDRFNRHIKSATQDAKTYIGRAIYKYGPDNFIVQEIDMAKNLDELNKKEIYWIKYYNSTDSSIGYNLTDGGDGGNTYKYKSENELNEIKKKLSDANLGKKNGMSKQIKVLNIKDNTTYIFDTLMETLNFLGIKHKASVIDICEHKSNFYYKNKWNFAYINDEFETLQIKPKRTHYGVRKCILLDKISNKEYKFNSKTEAKKFANISGRENETSTWKIIDLL